MGGGEVYVAAPFPPEADLPMADRVPEERRLTFVLLFGPARH